MRIISLVTIWESYESSLFLDELIKVVQFVVLWISSSTKCLHSKIKCIHCSRHWAYELWLCMINKTVNLISSIFNFWSLFHKLRIRFRFLLKSFITTLSSPCFPIVSMRWIFFTIVDSLFLMETLYVISICYSLWEWFMIIRL